MYGCIRHTVLSISQGLMRANEPKQIAGGIYSHTALPQTGPEAAHLGDTHRHSFSSKKEVGYQ